ncbi:MAG: DNA primase noncatalytic subunit PriX [Candidatus Micrarchaeia archaeon]
MQFDDAKLDFAYKYPFSSAAKEIIQVAGISKVSYAFLNSARSHLELALLGKLDYKHTSIGSIKLDYLVNYAYCRMLASAYQSASIASKYAEAEAARSAEVLGSGTLEELVAVSSELGIKMAKRFMPESSSEIAMYFDDFLKYSPGVKGLELVNQRLSAGAVILDWNTAIRLVQAAAKSRIMEGLPIKLSELPQEIVSFAKSAKLAMPNTASSASGGAAGQRAWIEKLLNTPIPDVRHRTVNLILAPYLVNVKGMSPEDASKVINSYIARCKELNPDTKITERYVEYQCNYSKKRGMKPLSQVKAKELLGGIADIWDDGAKNG